MKEVSSKVSISLIDFSSAVINEPAYLHGLNS